MNDVTTTFAVRRSTAEWDAPYEQDGLASVDEGFEWGWQNLGHGFQVIAVDSDGATRLVGGQP